MPLSKIDRFKAAFGYFTAEQMGDWEEKSTSALLSLRQAADALQPADPDSYVEIDALHTDLTGQHSGADRAQHAAAASVFRGVAAEAKAATRIALGLLTANQDTVAAVLAGDGGAERLDDLIALIGDKTSSDQEKRYLKAAIKARFHLTLEGDMGSNALPRMYQLLQLLPEDHTAGNDRLQHIKREKAGKPKGGYSAADNSFEMQGALAGRLAKKTQYKGLPGNDVEETDITHFDAIVTHEVGHAVEHNLGLAVGDFNDNNLGGWAEETSDTIVAVATNKYNFNNTFPNFTAGAGGRSLLKEVLDGKMPRFDKIGAALTDVDKNHFLDDPGFRSIEAERQDERGNPRNLRASCFANCQVPNRATLEPILKTMFDRICNDNQPLADVINDVVQPLKENQFNWQAIRSHDTIKWLKDLGAQKTGNWKLDEGELSRFTHNGRVYQQSYPDQFTSYSNVARANMVRNYQFRAPGEWFAELYTAYFLGVLSDAHPNYDWIVARCGQRAD